MKTLHRLFGVIFVGLFASIIAGGCCHCPSKNASTKSGTLTQAGSGTLTLAPAGSETLTVTNTGQLVITNAGTIILK